MQFCYILETPFGQLPILEIDGEVYTESIAMSRYIANEVKLAGNNNKENLKIDAIVDVLSDFLERKQIQGLKNGNFKTIFSFFPNT